MRSALGRTEVVILTGCLILGFLYTESNRVIPSHHLHYEQEMARILALDTRTNEDVLRAGAGLLHHYDELVRDQAEVSDSITRISTPPVYLDSEDQQAYLDSLDRLSEEARRKAMLTERFKSAHAAVRGSLKYLPIVSESLNDRMSQEASDSSLRVRVSEDIGKIITFMAISGTAEHAAGRKALKDLSALSEGVHPGLDLELLSAVAAHSRNVLERKPELDRLIQNIVDSPMEPAIIALKSAYETGHTRAMSRAKLFQRLLYLCAAVMLIFVASVLRRLRHVHDRLEEANLGLEERVRERTAELTAAKNAIEADGQALSELNKKLELSYQTLDTNRREQLEVRDKFLSHVSHELRTPLTAVHQFVSLVLDGVAGEIEEEQKEYLEIAFRNVNQLTRMISDLMEVTRAQSGKLRIDCGPTDVPALAEEVVSTLTSKARDKGVELSVHADGEIPSALADEERVRQVLNNLIENAIKFTPEGGTISVSTRFDEEDGSIRACVRDTGYGIAAESLERVFDQLHQESSADLRSRKGLGLGLSICKELIERQAGRIWVESTEGVGSTFHFSLPAFQLEHLIKKALQTEGGMRDEFSLICVEIESRSEGNLPESLSRYVRHNLQRFIYAESDMLLPRMRWEAEREQFWIVATTGAEGASAIIERIGDGLMNDRDREAENLVFDIDTWVFDTEELERSEGGFSSSIQRIGNMIYEIDSKEMNEWNERRYSSSMTTQTSESV